MDERRDDYRERIRRVLLYIRDHIDEDVSLDTLAEVANFSRYHFHRFFCGMTGETVAGYIRRLRLEHAAHNLKYGKKRITDIAYDAGYANLESFTRAFRAYFGMLPSEFKARKAYFKVGAAGWPTDTILCNGSTTVVPYLQGGTDMDVKICNKQERKVIFVRHTGPYAECGAAWGKLCAWAGPKGLIGKDTQFLGLSYDDPQITAPEKIRYDACIVVKGDIQGEGEIGAQNIPAGDYAVCVHKGPYENLSKTYAELCGGWLADSGRELKHAPSVEIYLNDPKTTPPQNLLVEIQVPLK